MDVAAEQTGLFDGRLPELLAEHTGRRPKPSRGGQFGEAQEGVRRLDQRTAADERTAPDRRLDHALVDEAA